MLFLILGGFLMIMDSYVQFKRFGEKINGVIRIINNLLEGFKVW